MYHCINNLRMVASGKEQWALAVGAKEGDLVDVAGVNEYNRDNTTPMCRAGGSYVYGPVGEAPICTHRGARANLAHRLQR